MARRKPLPQALPVAIESLDEELRGVAHTTVGEVTREVRLRNALPGETVVGRVLKRRRGLWLGNAQDPEVGAAARREAACEVFPRCGGCALQHLSGQDQLNHKENELRAALSGHAVQPRRWLPPGKGPQFGYRRKARVGVRVVGDQVFVGFREAFASRVVDMHACPALDPRLSALIGPLRAVVARLSVCRAVPQIELAAGDARVAVVLRHLEPLQAEDVEHLASFAASRNVDLYTQAGGYDTVQPLPGRPAALLSYSLPDFGLSLQFAAAEFTQVNPHINQMLVRQAVDALCGYQVVADLFCGIGNFSLALARRGASVHGFEASASSIARARDNAARNSVVGEFEVYDLYGEAAGELPLPQGTEALLLDPPRSGAGPHLQRWLAPTVQAVAYVSCNPVTFAADAQVLQDAGFVLEYAGVFDMFPQTLHVETLGVFRRT